MDLSILSLPRMRLFFFFFPNLNPGNWIRLFVYLRLLMATV